MSPTRFVWYELMTTDPSTAEVFYRGVVGWGTQPFTGHEHMDYTMWTVGEEPIGGLMELPEEARRGGAPPHWLGYVGVADVDAAAEKAGQLGGCVLVAPQDIPGAGRFAVVADPQGATFALYQTAAPGEETGEPPGGPGRFSWHELATTDHEAAFEFYRGLFGWTVHQDMDMGEHGIYRIYGPEGAPPLGGMFTKPAAMPGPPVWVYYATVDDLDAAVERVRQAGGQVVLEPMEVPGGDRIAQCLDPQGAFFALHWTSQTRTP